MIINQSNSPIEKVLLIADKWGLNDNGLADQLPTELIPAAFEIVRVYAEFMVEKGLDTSPQQPPKIYHLWREREFDRQSEQLRQRMRSAIRVPTIAKQSYQLRGPLDRKRIVHAYAGVSDFTRTAQAQSSGLDLAIAIGVDISGSMNTYTPQKPYVDSGSRQWTWLEWALWVSALTCKAAHALGIPVYSFGWGANAMLDPPTYMTTKDAEYKEWKKRVKDTWGISVIKAGALQRIAMYIIHRYVHFHERYTKCTTGCGTDIRIFNDWHQPPDTILPSHLAQIDLNLGGTPTPLAYKECWHQLEARPEKYKLAIVITDGHYGNIYPHSPEVPICYDQFDVIAEEAKARRLGQNIITRTLSLNAAPPNWQIGKEVGYHVYSNWENIKADMQDTIIDTIRTTSSSIR